MTRLPALALLVVLVTNPGAPAAAGATPPSAEHAAASTVAAIDTAAASAVSPDSASSVVAPPAPFRSAVQRSRFLMGTTCTAVVESADTARAAARIGAAFDEIARLELVMSAWIKDSEVSHMNANGGSMWFPCSPDLYAVLDSALNFARITDGAFDPTIEPLNRLWNIRSKGTHLPHPFETEQTEILVGWRKLNVDRGEHRVLFPFSGMGIDLGGIGKGFALDRARPLLRPAPADRALVDFGGEMLVIGAAPGVFVGHPLDPLTPVVRLTLNDAAAFTSSQYEPVTTTKKKQQHVGHVFDPRTGQPVPGQGSVTVVARSATRADALSTALLVMGREGAEKFATSHPEIGVLWLEPSAEAVHAWVWNLPTAEKAPDARLEWMNR